MQIPRLLLSVSLLAVASLAAQTLPVPAYTPVTVTSEGVLRTPTDFFAANAEAIASALDLDTALAAKADLSGAAFTGGITAPSVSIGSTGYLSLPTTAQTTAGRLWLDSEVLAYRTGTGTKTVVNTTTTQTIAGNKAFTGNVVLPSTTTIGSVSSTELEYLDGVTSAIQTQINAKAPLANPTFTDTVTLPSTVNGSGSLTIKAASGSTVLRSPNANNYASIGNESVSMILAGVGGFSADTYATNVYGQSTAVQSNTDIVFQGLGGDHELLLRADGTIAPWGYATDSAGGAGKIAITNADGNVNDLIDGSKMVSAVATGTAAEVESVVLPAGVVAFETDTGNLRVGDGTSSGGKAVVPPLYSYQIGDGLDVDTAVYIEGELRAPVTRVDAIIGSGGGPYGDLIITGPNGTRIINYTSIAPDGERELRIWPDKITVNPGSPITEEYGLWFGDDTAIFRSAANTLATNDKVRLTDTTASTSTSTGALVIGGGLGVGGRITASSVSANIVTTINAQTGTTYTLTSTDAGRLVTLTNTDPITVEVPPDATTIDIGSSVEVAQMGAGQVTLAPGSGVTLVSFGNALTTSGLGATAVLTKTAADTWLVRGNLIP